MSASSGLLGAKRGGWGALWGAHACDCREEQGRFPLVSGVFLGKSVGELPWSCAGDLLRDSVSPWVRRGRRCLAELLGDRQRVMNYWGKSAPLVR